MIHLDPAVVLIFVVVVAFALVFVLAADIGLLKIREDDDAE